MAESSLRLPEDQRLDLVQGPLDNQAIILHSLKDLSDLKERVRMQPFHDIRRKAIDLLFPPLDAETRDMLLNGSWDVSPKDDKK
jgi:hypothetical protein